MRSTFPVFTGFSGALLAAIASLVMTTACSSDPEVAAACSSTKVGKQVWTAVQKDLPGALLSVWGSSTSDIWTVGARDKATQKPTVQHFDGTAWSALDTGTTGDVWWVFGPDEASVWMVGSSGSILRYDRASQKFTSLASPTTATLYGIWGAGDGTLWAVGGFVGSQPPKASVVVKIVGDKAELVSDLPAGIAADVNFFKVWGSSASDVWVIGEGGTVLRYDGKSWRRDDMPGKQRLVTLHGSSADDMVIVGGMTAGLILERRNQSAWKDASPKYQAPLSGVFVRGCDAIAAGMGTSVLRRTAKGWTDLPTPPTDFDFHGVWIDPAGNFWFAGGSINSTDAMDHGVLAKFEP